MSLLVRYYRKFSKLVSFDSPITFDSIRSRRTCCTLLLAGDPYYLELNERVEPPSYILWIAQSGSSCAKYRKNGSLLVFPLNLATSVLRFTILPLTLGVCYHP